MGDRVVDEIENVRVRDRVNDRLSRAPPANQPGGRQNLKARRHGRDLLALDFAELANVQFAFSKTDQDAQSIGISHRAEHLRRSLELTLIWPQTHRIPRLRYSNIL